MSLDVVCYGELKCKQVVCQRPTLLRNLKVIVVFEMRLFWTRIGQGTQKNNVFGANYSSVTLVIRTEFFF